MYKYTILHTLSTHFSITVTKKVRIKAVTESGNRINRKLKRLKDKQFLCPIYYTTIYHSCSNMKILWPTLVFKIEVVSSTNSFHVIYWLAVALVSVFFWKHYHHHLHWKLKQRLRQTISAYYLGFQLFLFSIYFEDSTTAASNKNINYRQ